MEDKIVKDGAISTGKAIKNKTISEKVSNEDIDTTQTEDTHDIQDLIDNCEALGYRKDVVAGALFNCQKKTMTKSEFDKTIKNFLGKKVK